MSIEIEVLSEVYSILKQYIPTKDRQEAADNVISVVVDLLNDHDASEFATSDSQLNKAFKEYSFVEDENEFDEDD